MPAESRRVVTTGVKRVASTDSPGPFQRAFDRSMLLHRLDEVATAGRMKATLLADQRTQKDLIQPHNADENAAGQVDEHFPEI